MATIGQSTYYDTTWSKDIPKNSPAHWLKAYLSRQNQDTSEGAWNLFKQLGLVSGEPPTKGTNEAILSLFRGINANPQLANQVLTKVGLGTPAQKQAFKTVTTTPGSGVTAEMRANNPTAAASQYAKIDGTYGGGQSPASGNSSGAAQSQANVAALLNDPNLTADQRNALSAIYDAISSNDSSKADQIKAAMAAATKYSDPYFKAQIRLASDALDRAFNAQEGDLAYNENQLNTQLNDLRKDLSSAKDYLSFQEQGELKQLERQLTQELDTTRNDMAARGFTTSSTRSQAEQLLNDSYGDLRESTKRSFREKTNDLTNRLNRADRDTATEIERLRELAMRNKTNTYRQAEEQLGTSNLPRYSGVSPLGDIGGSIPRAQAQDAFSFASQFVF